MVNSLGSLDKYPQYLGLKDIGIITKKNTVQVANWRRSHDNFPIPVTEISGAPIYNIRTVLNWLHLRNIEYDLSLLHIQQKKSIDKQFAIIGTEQVGKTRFATKFCEHEHVLRKCYETLTHSGTLVPHKFVIKKYCPEPMCFVRYISAASSLDGIQAPLTEPAILEFCHKIENENYYTTNSGLSGKKVPNPEEDIIEIYTSASPLATALLEEEDDGVIIHDTPSLGKDFDLASLPIASTFVLMLDENTPSSIESDIAKMIPHLAGASIIPIIRMGDSIENQRDFDDVSKRSDYSFAKLANRLESLIAETSSTKKPMPLLRPILTTIPLCPFKSSGTNYAEKKFNEDVSSTLKNVLSHDAPYAEQDGLAKSINTCKEPQSKARSFRNAAIEIISGLASKIPLYRQGSYSKEMYVNEGHTRSAHVPGYMTALETMKSKSALQKAVYEELCKLSPNDCENGLTTDEQKQLINFCFAKISLAITTDCGLADSSLAHEEFPPLVTWIHESIVADELSKIHSYDLADPKTPAMSSEYAATMSSLFHSTTWGYVSIRSPFIGNRKHFNKKIEVLARCRLFDLPTNDIGELVHNCYVIGLFVLDAYSIIDYFTEAYGLPDNGIEDVGNIADAMRA